MFSFLSSPFVPRPAGARPGPPGFMHQDAAPAPDASRAKKPPSHSGWWGMLRLRRAKRRIERTEKQDTKDWRRTYLTGRREYLLRYLVPTFVIDMTAVIRAVEMMLYPAGLVTFNPPAPI